LSGIGKNAEFVENIARYERVFQECFSKERTGNSRDALEYINILPLEHLSDKELVKSFLVKVLKKAANRRDEKESFDNAIEAFRYSKNKVSNVHRNAAVSSAKASTRNLSRESKDFFDEEKEKMVSLCNENSIPWS